MAEKISQIRVSDVDYDLAKSYKTSSSTSLENLDVTNDLIYVRLSGPTTFSLKGTMEVGQKLTLIIEPISDFIQTFSINGSMNSFGGSIYFKNGEICKIDILCYDNKYILTKLGGSESPQFTIHLKRNESDPAQIVTVEGMDPEKLLSQFKRCLCKKVSDNNVKICYLNDNNTEQYYDGTAANTDGTEGDVMVYFPEMWIKGETTDSEHKFNISTIEQPGYKHIPASLVGAYKAVSSGGNSNNSSGYLYSKSGVQCNTNISMSNFSTQARNRGDGYHLIDYQQHCIIAWMFYARYKNTNSQIICGVGIDGHYGILNGVTNNLGIKDTTVESSANLLVNFLGIEGCWGYVSEWIEGIHSYNSDGVIAYDKGDYHDQSYDSISTPNKRILRTPDQGDLNDYITDIIGGENMDMCPLTASGGSDSTYYSDYGYLYPKSSYVFYRSRYNAETEGGVNYLDSEDFAFGFSDYGSRLAFDGNIEIISDVNAFKSLEVVS